MNKQVYHVLFLCSGNSARSIMAEAILNQLGRGTFQACSAGAHPTGIVNPLALTQLRRAGFLTEGYRSKSWDEFAGAGIQPMDFVFTLCDIAGKEACAMLWPGEPITAAWGIPDPAAVQGSEEEKIRAFRTAFLQLQTRISLFLALPLESIDRMSLQRQLMDIGLSND